MPTFPLISKKTSKQSNALWVTDYPHNWSLTRFLWGELNRSITTPPMDGIMIHCRATPIFLASTHIYVAVQFYPWFNFYFPLVLCMVIHDNELKTKENKKWTKDKIEPQHIHLGRKRHWEVRFLVWRNNTTQGSDRALSHRQSDRKSGAVFTTKLGMHSLWFVPSW